VKEPGDNYYDDVSVVMITRNEEGAVGKVVSDALSALPGCEVFVIDGSTDSTPEKAREAGATVVQEPGGGFGPALIAALRTPQREIIATVDADDTYPASAFPVLVNYIREGFDVAGTDRLGKRPPKTMPLPNWIFNKTFNVIASARTRKKILDVHSGQRAYNRRVIADFEWDFNGLAFPVDLLFWPAMSGRKVVEIPIVYSERIGETTLHRWESGKATMKRLLRSRKAMKGAEH
jgi:dolichol-phosphate hexosyltransferase